MPKDRYDRYEIKQLLAPSKKMRAVYRSSDKKGTFFIGPAIDFVALCDVWEHIIDAPEPEKIALTGIVCGVIWTDSYDICEDDANFAGYVVDDPQGMHSDIRKNWGPLEEDQLE